MAKQFTDKSTRKLDLSIPGLSNEAREAVNAAFDAMSTWRTETVQSSEKNLEQVIEKMAAAGRALGWPQQIVDATRSQMQTMTKMQIQMMDHTTEVWREQIKSWPSRSPPDNWLDAEAFKAMSVNTAQFWTRMGEQWQKNWAQMMMSQWVGEPSKRSDDRE